MYTAGNKRLGSGSETSEVRLIQLNQARYICCIAHYAILTFSLLFLSNVNFPARQKPFPEICARPVSRYGPRETGRAWQNHMILFECAMLRLVLAARGFCCATKIRQNNVLEHALTAGFHDYNLRFSIWKDAPCSLGVIAAFAAWSVLVLCIILMVFVAGGWLCTWCDAKPMDDDRLLQITPAKLKKVFLFPEYFRLPSVHVYLHFWPVSCDCLFSGFPARSGGLVWCLTA